MSGWSDDDDGGGNGGWGDGGATTPKDDGGWDDGWDDGGGEGGAQQGTSEDMSAGGDGGWGDTVEGDTIPGWDATADDDKVAGSPIEVVTSPEEVEAAASAIANSASAWGTDPKSAKKGTLATAESVDAAEVPADDGLGWGVAGRRREWLGGSDRRRR